jgi:translation initiation factor 6 (eIF-6)
MDEYFQQTFDIRFLKIGTMVNSGVLQIGCGALKADRVFPVGYTTVGTTLVPLTGPPEFAVPLQAPVRPKL